METIRDHQGLPSADNWDLERIVHSIPFRMKLNELRMIQSCDKVRQNIKVSVIMPTWNRASIIQRAIDSVLRQRYGNFELLISDDGSTDNTEHLIKVNYGQYKTVKYLKHTHAGVSNARNRALNCSRGDLIAYLDSDNVWSENYLLLMVNAFRENPDAATMYCGIRVIDEFFEQDYILFKQYERSSLLERNYIDLNIFMHRRELFEKLNGFNINLPVLEDWELIARYTKNYEPYVLECSLATYYLDKRFDHLTLSKDINAYSKKVRELITE
jgi:glycosyltransferase involved in cell wall biosynthesis